MPTLTTAGAPKSSRQFVEIPYCPRRWAAPLHASFRRWACLVLHRRAGKTTGIINHHQRAALDDRWERARLTFLLPAAPPAQIETLLKRRVYWHVMPTRVQAERTAWQMTQDTARVVKGVKFNQQKLLVTYPNGNTLQLLGADDPDSLRGPGLSGLSLDEYSQISSRAFGEVLSKSLADHVGYCIFAGTIKGHDQLYEMYETTKADPEWFTLWQNIDVSLKTETGATITALTAALIADRKLVLSGLMTQAEFDQEWYLAPEAAIRGAIYGAELTAARKSDRLTRVPIVPSLPVETTWDIGYADSTAIWFTQSLKSGEVHVVDYYESSGEGLPHYIQVLEEKRVAGGYVYGDHWAPHDIEVHEYAQGRSRLETAVGLGLKFKVVPRVQPVKTGELEDGIHAARMLFPLCWFDAEKCQAGLEALTHYRREYNERLEEFKATPVHDWASHGADAFRYLAVRQQPPKEKRQSSSAPVVNLSWAG